MLLPVLAVASVAEGYDTAEALVPGTIVSLDTAKPSSVQPANVERVDNLLGVVVPAEGALLNISSGPKQAQVATSGVESVIVSNAEGDIKNGDRITASFVNGVGARTERSGKVLGIAQADFNKDTANVSKRTVQRDGQDREILIGQIPVAIDVTYFAAPSGPGQSIVPDFIQKVSDAVGGKKVSTPRILIGAGILIAALMSVTVLMYAAVKSSIISIGRNPLSQSAVRKSLMQVLLAAVTIVGVALAAIYLLFAT